jgi:hypothetical protein
MGLRWSDRASLFEDAIAFAGDRGDGLFTQVDSLFITSEFARVD